MEQSSESVVAIEKGAFRSPLTTVVNFTYNGKTGTSIFLNNDITCTSGSLKLKNQITTIIGVETFHGIVTNMLNCDLVVNAFDLQLCYYIYFQANTLGKGMNFQW